MKKREKKLKLVPLFNSEREEAAFWEKMDSTDYFPGMGNVQLKMPVRTTTISLRLPRQLLERIKRLAQMKDVPYQSLMKIYIDERARKEISALKKAA